MVAGRAGLGVGLPPVGVVVAISLVTAGQRRPQTVCRRDSPAAEHPSHDAARDSAGGHPGLEFALAAVNKGSHFVKFERFWLLLFSLFWP